MQFYGTAGLSGGAGATATLNTGNIYSGSFANLTVFAGCGPAAKVSISHYPAYGLKSSKGWGLGGGAAASLGFGYASEPIPIFGN